MKSYTKFMFFAALLMNIISLIYAQNSCSSSHCGSSNVRVHYPFRFEHEASPITSCTYFNLTCHEAESTVAVNLPNAGEFHVHKISYAEKYIQLYDPANCLVPRLFDLSLDSSPLKGGILDNFTLYMCPSGLNADPIPCLSNSTNISIAAAGDDSYLYDERCDAIRSNIIPVDHDDAFLNLTWYHADCVKCGSGSRGSKAIEIVAVAFTLPGLIIVALSCCSVFCFHLMKMLRDRIDGEAAAVSAASSSGGVGLGLDESKIMGCVELVVVSESNEGLIQSGNSKTCSICLENYREKETVSVISKCGHCFHANCIHQWLGKNATCPVCRISLSDVV